MKYIIFLILIAFGFLIVWKNEKFMEFFGRVEWAEKTFGFYGGSRMFYKMLGITIIILSAMMLTGWLQKIILAIFAPMIGGSK
ncbi:MAG: hypothetical protein ABIF17_04920 [Patescibacteria group bacterium]